MMAKERSFHDDYSPFVPTDITVYEKYPGPHPTGLVNQDGKPIVRIEVPEKMGFVHFRGENGT